MGKVNLYDALNYISLSDPFASPSGEFVIYKTHRPVLESNDYEHKAHLRPASGTDTEIPYFSGKAVWLKDSSYVIAVQDEGKTSFVKYSVSGESSFLFEVDAPASLEAVTKTGGVIYSRVTDIGLKARLENAPEAEHESIKLEFRHRDEDSITVDEFPYWSDERGIINKLRKILYLYEGGKSIQLTEDTFDVKNAVLNAADNTLWVVGGSFTVKAPLRGGLYKIRLDDLTVAEILPPEEKGISAIEILDGVPVIIADEVYVIKDNKLISVLDSELSYGTSVFSDVVYGGGLNVSSDGNRFFFVATYEETANIYSLDKAYKLKQESFGNRVVNTISASDKGIYWIGLSGLKHQELYLLNEDGNLQLTDYNEELYRDKELSKPEEIRFTDAYGKVIVGWILRPTDYEKGRRYPAILDIHGGPRGAYGAVYFNEMQYWAANGYFVIYANPCGGTGRGKDFLKVENGLGGEDYEDLMQFVDIVLDKYPEIDDKRLGVTGGSYGGFLTNWIIGHTNRFAAAASQRSTANNITESTAKDMAPGFTRSYTDPQADDRYEKLWDGSPLKYIGKNVTTPTLFLHSLNDYRCYHIESVQMYAQLQYFDVPARMVLFKNEHHGLSRDGHPRNRIRRIEEITSWMDKYLK